MPDEAPWDAFAFAMDRMNREEAWYAPSVSMEIVGSMRAKSERGALDVFVAERDRRVVGTVGLAMHRGVASIFSVGTLPDARRRGVGRTLVIDTVERAHAAGADLVYLIARAEDSPKDMYRKLGFHAELGFDVWLTAAALASLTKCVDEVDEHALGVGGVDGAGDERVDAVAGAASARRRRRRGARGGAR